MAETRYIGWSAGDSAYVCDGTDDHVQINQALAWAAANPGNTVYLRGPHTYIISNKLLIGSYTVFTGDATAEIKLDDSCMWASMTPIIAQINGSGTYIAGVEISGFKINGNEANLYHDGEGDPERIHGKGYYNCIHFQGTATVPVEDIHIHDMDFKDSMGDGCRIVHAKNVRIHNNTQYNLMHSCVFFIDVVGGDIYSNDIKYITNTGVRLDNCQSIKIRDNTIVPWMWRPVFGTPDGPTSAPDGGDNAIQVGNEPDSYNMPLLTKDISIYNNTIRSSGIGGICLMDTSSSSGTITQNVHIYNNLITGCGWGNTGVTRRAGIAVHKWGNGLKIENNTINGNYHAGIKILDATASGVTCTIKNNNVTSTITQGGGGYGIWNVVPSKMSVIAETNYVSNNSAGNYYQVTPVSEAISPITETLPGDSTDTDDSGSGSDPIPDPGLDPGTEPVLDPVIIQYQREIDDSYYIDGRTAYVNQKPFDWGQKKISVSNSLGQDKCPGAVGWALTDFDLEGCELTMDCGAQSLSEMHEAIAAFTQPGRITVELGGDFSKWQASGTKGEYSTDLRLGTIIPRNYHPYSFLLVMDKPYYESVIQRMRSRYIYNSMQFSADDCYTGNLIRNASFEDWTPNQIPTWTLQTTPEDNDYRCVRYAKETQTFCAVSRAGATTKVILSDGDTWRLPAGTNSFGTGWSGLAWCPEWSMWVACSLAGTSNKVMVSTDNGDTWTSKTTPVNDNGWSYVLWIPPNDTVTTGRVIIYAQSGKSHVNFQTADGEIFTTSDGNDFLVMRLDAYITTGQPRSMYSDDMCETWHEVETPIEYNNWISAAYAPELGRIAVVAYGGSTTQRVMTSDDFGESYTAQNCPALALTSIVWADTLGLFVACADAPLSETFSQIMTSPSGLGDTWTLRDVPVATQTVTPADGDISTETIQTPDGYVYSAKTTDWSAGGGPSFTVPALDNDHYYRIDRVFCKLKSEYSGVVASIKFTVQFGSGTETLIKEWTNSTTTYASKSLNVALVSGANESVTVRCYMKTSNGSYKAINTDTGFVITEAGSTGGSVAYTYNKLRSLVWARERGVLMAVSEGDTDGGTANGAILSVDSVSWLPAVLPSSGGVYNLYTSVAYADDINKLVAVSRDGISGSRAMVCSNYGSVSDVAPNGWTYVSAGQSRSSETAKDGLYSVKIEGDGSANRGVITQKQSFEANTRYVISGFGKVEGLTAGSLKADIISGNSVIKELTWDSDTDWNQRKITFSFDVRPSDAYVRIRGSNLNYGAVGYIDKMLIERASDFELSQTGANITTYGTVDTTPDVILTGVTSAPDTTISGNSTQYSTDVGNTYTTKSTSYTASAAPIHVLPSLSDGAIYRIEEIHAKLRNEHSGTVTYMKVTMQTGTGAEVTLAEWTTSSNSFVSKSAVLSKESATGQKLTFRYYMKSGSASYKAVATEIGYKISTMSAGALTSSNVYMWNTADTTQVMDCCDTLLPKYRMEINSDGSGSLTYAEDFLDSNYTITLAASSGVTYNSTNKSIVIASGGYITFAMPCKYPVTGVPYLKAYVFSGAPQISIAETLSGTYYSIDGNQTTETTGAEINRLLENENSLELANKTAFYVKIAPDTVNSCEFGELKLSAALSTIDAERFKIYATKRANTIGIQVSGKSSLIATLRYRDLDPAT